MANLPAKQPTMGAIIFNNLISSLSRIKPAQRIILKYSPEYTVNSIISNAIKTHKVDAVVGLVDKLDEESIRRITPIIFNRLSNIDSYYYFNENLDSTEVGNDPSLTINTFDRQDIKVIKNILKKIPDQYRNSAKIAMLAGYDFSQSDSNTSYMGDKYTTYSYLSTALETTDLKDISFEEAEKITTLALQMAPVTRTNLDYLVQNISEDYLERLLPLFIDTPNRNITTSIMQKLPEEKVSDLFEKYFDSKTDEKEKTSPEYISNLLSYYELLPQEGKNKYYDELVSRVITTYGAQKPSSYSATQKDLFLLQLYKSTTFENQDRDFVKIINQLSPNKYVLNQFIDLTQKENTLIENSAYLANKLQEYDTAFSDTFYGDKPKITEIISNLSTSTQQQILFNALRTSYTTKDYNQIEVILLSQNYSHILIDYLNQNNLSMFTSEEFKNIRDSLGTNNHNSLDVFETDLRISEMIYQYNSLSLDEKSNQLGNLLTSINTYTPTSDNYLFSSFHSYNQSRIISDLYSSLEENTILNNFELLIQNLSNDSNIEFYKKENITANLFNNVSQEYRFELMQRLIQAPSPQKETNEKYYNILTGAYSTLDADSKNNTIRTIISSINEAIPENVQSNTDTTAIQPYNIYSFKNSISVLNHYAMQKNILEYCAENNINIISEDKLNFLLENYSKTNNIEDIKNISSLFTRVKTNNILSKFDSQSDESIEESLASLAKIHGNVTADPSNYNLDNILRNDEAKINETIENIFSQIQEPSLQKKYFPKVIELLSNSITDTNASPLIINIFKNLPKEMQKEFYPLILESSKNIKTDQEKFNVVTQIYDELSPEDQKEFYASTYDNLTTNIKREDAKKSALFSLFDHITQEEKIEEFDKYFTQLANYDSRTLSAFFDKLDAKGKSHILKNYFFTDDNKTFYFARILSNYSISDIVKKFEPGTTLSQDQISKIIKLEKTLTIKTLLFDESVDREKLADMSSYPQLNSSFNGAIDINSILSNLYLHNDLSNNELNEKLSSIYNLLTYNNVPDFIRSFRMFQLSNFHAQSNQNIPSFRDKTVQERDSIILDDLFKIALDSNSESLREFSDILISGKKITTKLQGNPTEKIKDLTEEELALFSQYRDTLYDMHNLTSEIRDTGRPILQKSDDLIQDIRNLITTYGSSQSSNNLVFNPNKIINELFAGFSNTQIRPTAILAYMDKINEESMTRHTEISDKLKTKEIKLEDGDFIKGINNFETYLPNLLRNGVKGGEFNQEFSHSDATPLDADFGYISKANFDACQGDTDYEIISSSVSHPYGRTYIVLKNYQERLDRKSNDSIDDGQISYKTDYYSINTFESSPLQDRYIRTGIPTLDIDYLVSDEWQTRFGYEMAMAGVFIPVKDIHDNLVFTKENYDQIRSQMKGLSQYEASSIEVSDSITDVGPLFEMYRKISGKEPEKAEEDLESLRGVMKGIPDEVTEKKKSETFEFLTQFFKGEKIVVARDLSQNLSSKSVELIDTGSTGRGTNLPGDGDFDFMLRHNLPPEVLTKLRDAVCAITPKGNNSNGEPNFRDVGDGFRSSGAVLPNGEVVDIDVTCAPKSLSMDYSSDMCVRDRLNNIKENNPEKYNAVVANILMAKKVLKSIGLYKKAGSPGCSEYGGFGGIGVENWILQNNGSFEEAITTYLEAASKSKSYDDFIENYPIFDFGKNHRDKFSKHDRFSAFLGSKDSSEKTGFQYAQEKLSEIKELIISSREQGISEVILPNPTTLQSSISVSGFEEAVEKKPVLGIKQSYVKTISRIAKMQSQRRFTKDLNGQDPLQSDTQTTGKQEGMEDYGK